MHRWYYSHAATAYARNVSRAHLRTLIIKATIMMNRRMVSPFNVLIAKRWAEQKVWISFPSILRSWIWLSRARPNHVEIKICETSHLWPLILFANREWPHVNRQANPLRTWTRTIFRLNKEEVAIQRPKIKDIIKSSLRMSISKGNSAKVVKVIKCVQSRKAVSTTQHQAWIN